MRIYLLTLAATALVFAAACADAAKPPVRVENTAPAAKPAATAATAAADTHEDDGHDAARISLADAKKEFDAGTAFIVDVRDASAYNQEHIAGAVNITKATLEANISKIPKGKKIIAYCS